MSGRVTEPAEPKRMPVGLRRCPAGCCYILRVGTTSIHLNQAEFLELAGQTIALCHDEGRITPSDEAFVH